jgi:hypothetical protein
MVSPENVGYLCAELENLKYLISQARELALTGRNFAADMKAS